MTTTKGSFVLYSMLHAYNMLDIKVTGLTLRAVSITYTTTVGKLDACNKHDKQYGITLDNFWHSRPHKSS